MEKIKIKNIFFFKEKAACGLYNKSNINYFGEL